MKKLSFFKVFISVFLILLGFLIFVIALDSTRLLQSEDLVSPLVTSLSLVKEGNLEVGEYYNFLTKNYPNPDTKGDTPYYLKNVDGTYYSAFPLTISFLISPASLIYTTFVKVPTVFSLGILSRVIGIFVISLASGYFYLLCKKIGKVTKVKLTSKQLLILVLIFAFATNNFSMNAQGVWQHGFSNLFLTSAIFYLLSKKYKTSGLLFGLSVAIRPTNLLSLVVFGSYLLYLVYKNKQTIGNLVLFSLLSALPILFEYTLQYFIFGNLSKTGYGSQFGSWTGNFPEGFLGIWLSPSKGIFVYSPIFLFCFYYVHQRLFKRKKGWFLYDLSLVIILVHTLFMGKWFHWYGGYSWGYRMASDVIPYLVVLLIPFLTSSVFIKLKYLFYSVLLFSVFTHLLGVLVYDGTWHLLYDKGPKNTSWVWNIKDSQIIFSIKRVLFKIGLLKSNPFTV